MNGWIKLHRKILDWEWYSDTNTFRLFMHLLLKANREEKKWRGRIIKAGELVTGRKILAEELALSEQQIRTSLLKLKSTNEITIKSTSQNSIITLNNWNSYQGNQPAEQPTDNQRITTNKNIRREEERESIVKQQTTNNNVVSLTSSLYKGYGQYNNVYLSNQQRGALLTQMGSEKLLATLVDELSENIASKTEKVFDEQYPNMHYIRLVKYLKRHLEGKRKENSSNGTATYNAYG